MSLRCAYREIDTAGRIRDKVVPAVPQVPGVLANPQFARPLDLPTWLAQPCGIRSVDSGGKRADTRSIATRRRPQGALAGLLFER